MQAGKLVNHFAPSSWPSTGSGEQIPSGYPLQTVDNRSNIDAAMPRYVAANIDSGIKVRKSVDVEQLTSQHSASLQRFTLTCGREDRFSVTVSLLPRATIDCDNK